MTFDDIFREILGTRHVLCAPRSATVTDLTDAFSWTNERLIVAQRDPMVSSVVFEVPPELIKPILTEANEIMVRIYTREPYDPLGANTYLSASRKNLIFAANHCAHHEYDLLGKLDTGE